MHMMRKLITASAAAAVLAVVAASSAFAAGPAQAGPVGTARHDPTGGKVPREGDVVGVGADTDAFLLDQFSHDYNASHAGSAHLLYSWDALNPAALAAQ